MVELSVIITSYNHGRFVEESVRSILNQTFGDFELIVIDDASTDNSVEVLRGIKDPRLRLIALEENVGFCRAANIAIAEASGKYFKLMASDDVAREDLLKSQVLFLQNNPSCSAVFSKMDVINEKGQFLAKKTARFDRYFLDTGISRFELLNRFFFRGNCLAAPTAMIVKEAFDKVGGFDERMFQAHDFDLWVRLCLSGAEFHILPQRLVRYRRISSDGNMSSNTSRTRKRLVFDNEKILERYLEIGEMKLLFEIFPNLEVPNVELSKGLVPFFLAKEALRIGSLHHRQFALSVMYNLLSDRDIVEFLDKEFDFKINRDFMAMVEDNPLAFLNEIVNAKPFYRRWIKGLGRFIRIIFLRIYG